MPISPILLNWMFFAWAPIKMWQPQHLILLHLNFINFSNQVEGSRNRLHKQKAKSFPFCQIIYSREGVPSLSLPPPPSPAFLSNSFSFCSFSLMVKMRLQYLNDYDNQSGDHEPRVKVIFLSRTKKAWYPGDISKCYLGLFVYHLPQHLPLSSHYAVLGSRRQFRIFFFHTHIIPPTKVSPMREEMQFESDK